MTGLDLKFWGVASLKKISGLIGDFVHCDEATMHKTFLGYARMLVDVQVDQSFPATLQFKDEKGKTHDIKVEYDWVPVKCTQCQGIGHSKDQCRKRKESKKVKQVWQKKVVQPGVVQGLDKGKAPSVPATTAGPRVAVIQTPAGIITRVMSQDGSGPSVHRGNTFLDALNMATIRNTQLRKKGTGNGLGGVIENETKVKSVHWNKVRNAICSDWSICTNNSFATGGRIWLLWNSGLFDVDILDITSQTIHAQIPIRGNQLVFRFTLVYGYNKPADRVDLWQSLQRYKNMHQGPWMVIGSFFTWNNKQDLETLVYSRIDRCLINDDWMSMFPEAYAYFMPEGYFDHCPCVVYPFGKPITRKPHFKYFNMWRLDPNFKQVVSEGWHKEFRGTQMFQHVCKLKHLKHGLKRLNKGALGDIENKVKVAKLALHKMQEDLISNPMDPGMVGAAKILADELLHLKAAWYMFLEQKAKVDWTAMGDDNTHYFHSQLKHRRAQNKVIQIKDQGGKLCTESSDIQQAFIEYYNGLLGSSNFVDAVCESVIAAGPILNAAHHEILNVEVSANEIRKAMFDIGGNKAPGPDGFNSQFYKDTWEITRESVIKAMKDFFTSGKLLKQVNATLITLIPEVELPQDVTQFRPIACCNSIYKCISKVLCNRLSIILPDIISPSQSAFVKGRDIVENILICQDLVKLYNRSVVSPRVIMKIDLQKAYDSIEWSFVSNMLSSLNFPPIFTKLILKCVTTPSYTLALNEETFKFFHGKRGLRQGDPISPLIFVICMEYLSRILGKIQEYTKLKYHPLCGRIKLNHLAFADDLLLFCRGDRTSIIGLLRAFQSFSRASGLQMKKGKSSIYSNGVDNLVLTDIIKYSSMKHGSLPFKYLGIPIASKKLSVLECNCLVERVVSRIRSIGSRKLSYAGRLVLIKTTGIDNDKDSTLVSWDQICQAKKHGGLGVTDIIRWNKAALGKYIWWLAQKKDHLWVKWVHSIYIKSGDWHSYQPTKNGSWAWRKLCRVRDLIKAGYVGEWWLQNQQVYTIRSGYDWLGSPCMDIPWAKFIWDSGALPKISFIGWLVMQGRLLTRERLKRIGIVMDDSCVLCANAPETHAHLFFACEYSKRCLQILSSRLGCHLPSQDWFAWWNSQSFPSQKIQHQAAILLLALIYSIWWNRNHCKTENVLLRPEFLIARFDKNSFFVM
ncbi:uncharacterized protein LOC141613783 [Silene latifolia]|uniref:uncharacterized protein LOC141613783 n=1 Tax=Silene latifolia TaxID=37657 RepID=UPI003D78AF74